MKPSPEYAAGLLTAMTRECPVPDCRAQPGEVCTTPLMIRPKHGKDGQPVPMVLTGSHFNRVLPDHWTNRT